MPDYQLGKIYAIRSPSIDKFYIGSTVQELSKRFGGHKITKNDNRKCSSYIILEKKDAYIELIEAYPCNSKEELNRREGELIRFHKGLCVNIRSRYEDNEEYVKDNKDKIYERNRKYAEKNKEEISAYNKKYREENKEKIKEEKKKIYESNKEKILERAKEKYREKKRLKDL
jgi:hypothetical protein